MQPEHVAGVRRFNRLVTARVGALDDRFLARDRPLGEARVLWELGESDGELEVGALRARLGLDSGHASRLLRALERDGMVRVERARRDGRVRVARLTPAGRREREELDRRSDLLAEELLAPLDPPRRERLVAAMADVERLLTAALVELREVDPAHPDARRCTRAYLEELERRTGTAVPAATAAAADPAGLRPPAGTFLVASLRGEPVGCGGVKLHAGGAAEVKRLWVSPQVRGLGVGRRLLAALEDRARAAGAPATRLDTNRTLTEAIALYRAGGYVEVAPFNDEPMAHHWFEKRLGA